MTSPTYRSVLRWILSVERFENFPVRGLFMTRPADRHRRHYVFGLFARPCMHLSVTSLRTPYFTKCLAEFHRIYNIDAFGDNEELIIFWGQKVKDQGCGDAEASLSRVWRRKPSSFREKCKKINFSCLATLDCHNFTAIIDRRKFIAKWCLYGMSSVHFYCWNQLKLSANQYTPYKKPTQIFQGTLTQSHQVT